MRGVVGGVWRSFVSLAGFVGGLYVFVWELVLFVGLRGEF